MHYAILCYNRESAIGVTWTKDSEEAVVAQLATIQEKLTREGKLVSAGRLDQTTTATTLKKSPVEQLVLDGPFAETKEQLLGFYVVECGSMDEARRELERALELAKTPAEAAQIRLRLEEIR